MHVKMEHVRTCFYFELCKGIGCGFKVINAPCGAMAFKKIFHDDQKI